MKEILTKQVVELADSGSIHFYSGMADGSDVWLSQIVLGLLEAGVPLFITGSGGEERQLRYGMHRSLDVKSYGYTQFLLKS